MVHVEFDLFKKLYMQKQKLLKYCVKQVRRTLVASIYLDEETGAGIVRTAFWRYGK